MFAFVLLCAYINGECNAAKMDVQQLVLHSQRLELANASEVDRPASSSSDRGDEAWKRWVVPEKRIAGGGQGEVTRYEVAKTFDNWLDFHVPDDLPSLGDYVAIKTKVDVPREAEDMEALILYYLLINSQRQGAPFPDLYWFSDAPTYTETARSILLRREDRLSMSGKKVMIMELAQGSAKSIIQTLFDKKAWDLQRALEMFRGMMFAVALMHSRNVIHNDLNAKQFLLVDLGEEGDEEREYGVMLADFGHAMFTKEVEISFGKEGSERSIRYPRSPESSGFTMGYLAHEAVLEMSANRRPSRNAKGDVWSMGMVFHQMVAFSFKSPHRVFGVGEGPGFFNLMKHFYGDSSSIYDEIITHAYSGNVKENKLVTNILKNMLHADPEKRWSALEAYNSVGQALRYYDTSTPAAASSSGGGDTSPERPAGAASPARAGPASPASSTSSAASAYSTATWPEDATSKLKRLKGPKRMCLGSLLGRLRGYDV